MHRHAASARAASGSCPGACCSIRRMAASLSFADDEPMCSGSLCSGGAFPKYKPAPKAGPRIPAAAQPALPFGGRERSAAYEAPH
jgi:hypothetical protein